MKPVPVFFPVAIFGILIVLFYVQLQKDEDPSAIRYMDRPLPDFSLPSLYTDQGEVNNERLKEQVVLINVFGSWCVACQVEHPLLMEIAAADIVPLIGVNWRDTPKEATAWLERHGNPYSVIGADPNSAFIIDLGVTGAPETFIIDHKGQIRYKLQGPITPVLWKTEMSPLIRTLQQSAGVKKDT